MNPSDAEAAYRKAGLVRTQGTLFMLPPDPDTLVNAYTAPPRPKSRMSSGATALCKHFERGGASSERGVVHPFWPLPKGSNDNKNRLAAEILQEMLQDANWRNVMMLHQGVAVYEIRNIRGYGMRWTLQVEQQSPSPEVQTSQKNGSQEAQMDVSNSEGDWYVTKTIFRGFLEPIEGLDHELPVVVTSTSTD